VPLLPPATHQTASALARLLRGATNLVARPTPFCVALRYSYATFGPRSEQVNLKAS